MHDPNERTPEEMAELLAILNRTYIRMTKPGGGKVVTVHPDLVGERRAAGYTITTEN